MNQVATLDDYDQKIMELEKTQKLCALLMKTPHYAKMGPEGVFAIVSKAKGLGIDQMEALNGGLYYVQGKVGMPAETMSSLIRQKGHSIVKDKDSSDTVCILHGKRADNGDTWTIKFSKEDAVKAGLWKSMYEKYPGTMLYNRAMSFLARQLFPDIIRGAGYTLDELKEIAANSYSPQVVEESQKNIDVISKDQADELTMILSECDHKYQDSVWSTLRKAPIGIDSIEQLPASLFERIKNAAKKNIEKNIEIERQNRQAVSIYEDAEEIANEA